MTRHFVTLDVFTNRRFAGNPLAVVLEPDGLDTPAMQAVAREFNLSETVFVCPPADLSSRARLRIFTPGRELPFAGHPTVGTAVLLAMLDGGGDRDFVVEEQVGLVPCRVRAAGAAGGRAAFDIPKLPEREADAPPVAEMAAAVGLVTADFGLEGLAGERWSAGNPFTFVPVSGLDALARCRIDLARFDPVFADGGRAAAFLFCRETRDPDSAFHARMFAPSFGILEDPATGSAVAAFAGYLAATGAYADGSHTFRIEQGFEMGRASLIDLTITIERGRLIGAAIAGDAVVVMNGTIEA